MGLQGIRPRIWRWDLPDPLGLFPVRMNSGIRVPQDAWASGFEL
ncbi:MULTISPECIES: hypothetical protein [unclassified Streptomyces]